MGAACQLKILSYLCGKGIFILTKTIMKKFTCVQDIGDLKSALAESFEIKKDRFKYVGLGRNKTLLMIFFNSSLRTRLSTQKAALNLGMNVIVLDINQGAWKLETERGVIMDGDKPEHLLEAIPVMGCYCDVIGIRSFARFESKEDDYNEKILNQFIQYSGRPVFSMEAATRHPLQSFADLITIEEYKKTARPKVVMTWAPHPKALPQAVPNSFAEWMNATDYEFVTSAILADCLPRIFNTQQVLPSNPNRDWLRPFGALFPSWKSFKATFDVGPKILFLFQPGDRAV